VLCYVDRKLQMYLVPLHTTGPLLLANACCVTSVHVHPVKVLPGTWGHPRSALYDSHRHVEFGLHCGRAAHRLPAVSGRKRGRTARMHYGDLGSAAVTDAAGRHQTQTLLWFVGMLAWCVSLSDCYAAHLCKTAERIEVLFGLETLGDQRHIVLDGSRDPHTLRRIRCGLCQITLASCLPACVRVTLPF